MTDNILSFEDVHTEHQIAAIQTDLPRVILEGQDDVRLFEAWFIHLLDALVFVEAADVVRGGGCTQVDLAVRHSIDQDGVPAIGIVDRDTLFSRADWTNLFSTDDAAFAGLQTPEVTLASLWEVEAYLLRPELFPAWVETRSRTMPAPQATIDTAISAAVEECEALLDAAPVMAAAHSAGVGIADGWGANRGCTVFGSECEAEHPAPMASHSAVAEEVKALIAEIRLAAPSSPSERLVYLLRYVNTKRLLHRLYARLQLHTKSHWGKSVV